MLIAKWVKIFADVDVVFFFSLSMTENIKTLSMQTLFNQETKITDCQIYNKLT